MIETTQLRSGRRISVDLGPTLWRGRWTSGTLDDARFDNVRSWYSTILSAESFYGYDKAKEYPSAYKSGFAGLTVSGSPFDGTCTLSDVESNNVVIALEDLPSTFAFTTGDY